MFKTHKPTSEAEIAAAIKAESEITGAGFTPNRALTFITLVPGKGACVFTSSEELTPGTFGHPAATATIPVTA